MIAAACNLGGKTAIPEIFDDQQTLIKVFGEQTRRRKPRLAQYAADRDKRADIFGEVCDRAVGLAVSDRRTVGR